MRDGHLVAIGIAPLVVGVVADEVGVEIIEERVGAEIEGDAQDRHVVGVHHAMAEAVGLPQSDQFGIALDDFAVHRQIRLWLRLALGEMHGQHVLGENLLLFGLLGVVEVFEVAETYMAFRQAQEHGTTFLFFTPHRCVGADHAQGAAARYTQGMQGF
ncbi:hypothetical protein D9M73_203380 [compost metagenome]